MPAYWPSGGECYSMVLNSRSRRLGVIACIPPLGVASSVFLLKWIPDLGTDDRLRELETEVNEQAAETWGEDPQFDQTLLTVQLQTLRRGLDHLG